MNNQLWKRVNYTQPIYLLKSTIIYEYDIEKANISVLLDSGRISQDYYDWLYKQDRMVRQVIIGKMEKEDQSITKAKQQGIEEAKRQLFLANNIKDSEVLSIKNDAVFITRELTNLQFNHVKFSLRNHYTMYMRVFRCELYYLYDIITEEELLHIKGINDEILKLQEGYLLDFLKDLLNVYQTEGTISAISMLHDFYRDYMSKSLPLGFYRDIKTGNFLLDSNSTMYEYYSDISNDNIRSIVNISNNGAFLREISKILYMDYSSEH